MLPPPPFELAHQTVSFVEVMAGITAKTVMNTDRFHSSRLRYASTVVNPIPLRADELVVGCVTEDTPKYLGQTLRLVQSIRWFGGELANARIVIGAVERIDSRARRALEA